MVQIFLAQGQTRASRDHQFLLGVFNQIDIPIAQRSGHQQTPLSPLLPGLNQEQGHGSATQALVIVELRRNDPPK